eukprot:5523188-Prymnesium_polylepis.1
MGSVNSRWGSRSIGFRESSRASTPSRAKIDHNWIPRARSAETRGCLLVGGVEPTRARWVRISR